MTEHLPECPILKPCCDDEEFPQHGFCGNYVGRCLHCMAECICDNLRACEARVARVQYNAGHAEAIREAMRRITSLPAVVTRGPVGITEAAVIAALKDL